MRINTEDMIKKLPKECYEDDYNDKLNEIIDVINKLKVILDNTELLRQLTTPKIILDEEKVMDIIVEELHHRGFRTDMEIAKAICSKQDELTKE